MKSKTRFQPKILALMLVVCAAIALLLTWMIGVGFWILFVILVGAVLVNGLIATAEDKRPPDEE